MDTEKKESLLSISASPHIRTSEDTRSIMLDVLIALVPALAVAAYMFGLRAIFNVVLSVAGCMFFERCRAGRMGLFEPAEAPSGYTSPKSLTQAAALLADVPVLRSHQKSQMPA